ncbi:MAG: hypothetical protein AAF352_04245, partial [Pseudomonadota bacterium]
TTVQNLVKEAQQHLSKAQTSYKLQADKHRRNLMFSIGNFVLLSTRNLPPLPGHPKRKLGPKWLGPFRVERTGTNAYYLADLLA